LIKNNAFLCFFSAYRPRQARTIGRLVLKHFFFVISKVELPRKQKKNYQKVAKKNSKFFGAFYQTLGLWQIRSFGAGQKKSFV
jgi:hypothetical protein